MNPSRPYVVRALYQWILDNGCTPYVLVNADERGVKVPRQYVREGQIVLNVSPSAVADLVIGNEAMHFSGRFGGVPMDVHVPIGGVLGIYARENGQGMIFDGEETPPEGAPDGAGGGPRRPGKPRLKVVE